MQHSSESSGSLQSGQDVIQHVIDNLIDSQEAFQQIGERLDDDVVRRYLLAESLRRAEFRGDLETILHHEGVRDIEESGTVAGTVHRAWAKFRSSLGGGDHALLTTAETIEDGVYDAYDSAINSNLPASTQQVIHSQAARIKLSRDYVRAAREHAQAA